MVVAPDGLEFAKLQLKSAILCLRLGLSSHAFGLDILEQVALLVHELPVYVTEPFIVEIILKLLVLFFIIHNHFNFVAFGHSVFVDRWLRHWFRYETIYDVRLWHGRIPIWHLDKSLTVDHPQLAIVLQRITSEVTVASLERLSFWTVHLVPSAQKFLCIELLLDTSLRTLHLFFKNTKRSPGRHS